ncbi:uncharacterized protein BXZ73DRAFT_103700 [Epithele typhae]|uniref:uncharacterized protein n=1 Tax=Epithele typhae TaxID=378194 RepID=UPI002007A5F2|nr:uncharacterized protein BXZ73DRAFT_103700 [Epithele typhae]KAH9923968.1 hypothetical protein BXZ73DRAFT_103700 [Epithele typhae]
MRAHLASAQGNVIVARQVAKRYGAIISIALNPGNIQSELLRHMSPLRQKVMPPAAGPPRTSTRTRPPRSRSARSSRSRRAARASRSSGCPTGLDLSAPGGGGDGGDLLKLFARVRPGAVPDVPPMAHELHWLQFDCAPDPEAENALAVAFALDRMFLDLSEVGPAYVVLESHDGRERPGGGEDAQQEFWDDVCFGLECCETARQNRGERKMRRIIGLDG